MPRAIQGLKSRGLNRQAHTMVLLGLLMSLLVTLAPTPASAADSGETMTLPSVDNPSSGTAACPDRSGNHPRPRPANARSKVGTGQRDYPQAHREHQDLRRRPPGSY